MKHKHYDMIVAKAANMELVVMAKVIDPDDESGSYWAVSSINTLVIASNKFFLCSQNHKDACLHWLNGGEVQINNGYQFNDFKPHSNWHENHQFMNKSKIRIKPKKEKRWIVVNPIGNSVNCNLMKTKPDMFGYPDTCQSIEIEVEV